MIAIDVSLLPEGEHIIAFMDLTMSLFICPRCNERVPQLVTDRSILNGIPICTDCNSSNKISVKTYLNVMGGDSLNLGDRFGG